MPELQNLLRQRLARAENTAPVHPDADTITAYVEQSLPTAERQTVLTHLATCEPCREVVALSQPELSVLSASQTVIKPAPASAWRRLFAPGFGLAASVAVMALIAVLVLQLPHRASQQAAQEQQAKVIVPAKQAAPIENGNSIPAQTADNYTTANQTSADQISANQTSTSPAAKAKPESADVVDRSQNPKAIQALDRSEETIEVTSANVLVAAPAPPAKAPALTAGLLKKDYVNTNFFANSDDAVVLGGQNNAGQNSSAGPAPQAKAANTNHSFAYTDKISSFSDIPANAAGKPSLQLLTPSSPPERLTCTLCKVAQATAHTLRLRTVTPALHASTLGYSALGGLGMFSNTLEKGQPSEISAAPEKNEGGSLANSDALSRSALGMSSLRSSSDSVPTAWKVAGGKLVKASGQSQWEDAYPAAGIEFSAVNARGKDVWAGGSDAMLIHSRDAGLTWEVVKLGNTATGKIVSILAGAFNVHVKTSDNQLWLSTDDGKTWTLGSE